MAAKLGPPLDLALIPPQRWVRPLDVEPGHGKKQRPTRNLAVANGKTALHYAATAGHERVVQRLLKRGADRSLVDSDGNIALDVARTAGQSAVCRLLSSPNLDRTTEQ